MLVFDELLQGLGYRFCLKHLYSNFKKKIERRVLIQDLIMAAAKEPYYQAWDAKMQELKKLNELV